MGSFTNLQEKIKEIQDELNKILNVRLAEIYEDVEELRKVFKYTPKEKIAELEGEINKIKKKWN